MISKKFLSKYMLPPILGVTVVQAEETAAEAVKTAKAEANRHLIVEDGAFVISGVVSLESLLESAEQLHSQPIANFVERDFVTVSSEAATKIVFGKVTNQYIVIQKDGEYRGLIDRNTLVNDERFLESIERIINVVLDSTRNGILAVDMERNIIIANRMTADFFNVKESDIIDRRLDAALPSSPLNEADVCNVDLTPGKYAIGDRVIMAHRSPLMVGGKSVGLISVFQDITSFEAANEKLDLVRKNEKFLENIIESSYDGIYITNKNGRTLAVNQSYERISGIDRNALVGKYMNDLVREGILSVCVTDDVVVKKQPVTHTQTIRNGKKVVITGSPLFDREGNVDSVITNVRDITELIRLEKQIKIYNERMNLYQKVIFQDIDEEDIVCRSKNFEAVLNLAAKVSKMDSTVLILGETGVGKEIIAQHIHKNSERENAPYIKINCGAIPANLLESEFFGYVPGAFTGANTKGKMGMFELADGGTLFLDEIGEMPLELQSTLLRVLQDGEVTRVGDSRSRKVNVRIITATNRDLEKMIDEGRFRSDLFYRLNVVAIHVPPLRERLDDIPGLAEKMIQKLNAKYNYNKVITSNFINALMACDWPGNIRELNNFIEKQFVLSDSDILDAFAEKAQAEPVYRREPETAKAAEQKESGAPGGAAVTVAGIIPLDEARRELESILIKRAMKQGKSTHKAAALLNMSQPTFFRKYKELFPGGWKEDGEND